MLSDEYVKAAFTTVEDKLAKQIFWICKNVSTLLVPVYHSLLYISINIVNGDINYYHNLIGVLKWEVNLSHINIHLLVVCVSR